MTIAKITFCLWYDRDAEAAALDGEAESTCGW